MGAQRRDAVRRLDGRGEGGGRQIADVRIARELRPRPIAALLVNDGDFAVQGLGLERRLGIGRAAQRRAGAGDPSFTPLDEARRLDLAA